MIPKQLTLATSAADLTLTATSFPDDETCDLTITFHQHAASSGSFNIPLLIQDIPDLLSALSDILGPIHAQYMEDSSEDEPNAETEPTVNGLGEDILRELDIQSARNLGILPCNHRFMLHSNPTTGETTVKCSLCGVPAPQAEQSTLYGLTDEERAYLTAWTQQHCSPIDYLHEDTTPRRANIKTVD